MEKMKSFVELNLGFNDAINYRRRENKDLLNRFFVKSPELDTLLLPSTYFLIGDKGTGKTAYSVFLSNNEYKNTISFINSISETEYVKFITLKKEKELTLSDYTSIWKVLLLLLFSKQIEKGEDIVSLIRNHKEFDSLKKAIDNFYMNAFSPEIKSAFNIIENSEGAVKLMIESTGVEASQKKEMTYTKYSFQLNLLFLEEHFKRAFNKLKLMKNHLLFIDGIDIRPRNINYEDYLECVKGLANAIWELNNDYFANIKDSKGRMRVILLVRPDIFTQLGLQNLNNKVADNSVLLDWQTTYPHYRSSSLFNLADRILSAQQNTSYTLGECWDHYFPFKINPAGEEEDSFVSFLKLSMFRPRDIITLMKILQKHLSKNQDRQNEIVTQALFEDSQIRADYSRYMLGEIKDYLEFYHSADDYDLFLQFFSFLNGLANFTYNDYLKAYNSFADYIEDNNINPPLMFESSDKFLQFLYDLNVISFITRNVDGSTHLHSSFRVKNYSNVTPKVEAGVRYIIHPGLKKALNLGKKRIQKRVIKKK